jgi:2-iminoacetate synthase
MPFNYLENSFFTNISRLEKELSNNNFLTNSSEILSDNLIETTLSKTSFDLNDLPVLLGIAKKEHLQILLNKAADIKLQRFGKKINLYAPIYVSNHCSNICSYCGFNSTKGTSRIKLNNEQILKESSFLKNKGINHMLFVSGEDENAADLNYFKDILNLTGDIFDCVSIEIQPLDIEEYSNLYNCGLDGVTVYQETYLPDFYKSYHIAGKKKDYRYRLETPERAATADIPHVTIGALLGLAPHKKEMFYLAHHLQYLINKFWKVQFSLSFPRIVSENIDFNISHSVNDFDFVKTIGAMRLLFPDTPIYLSTREKPYMRDNLINYGVTHMSVESKTEPGGYTICADTDEQFKAVDQRPIEEIFKMLSKNNLRPVLKDWDKSYRVR